MATVFSRALEGDLSQGAQMLHAMDPAGLSERARGLRECMLARFERGERTPVRSGDELLDALLELYRTYWTDSLLKRRDKAVLEPSLHAGIDRLSSQYASVPPTGSLDDSAERIVELLKARSSYAITGRTLPYYELMAWRRNDESTHDIALPEGSVKVKVVLMDKFESLGWGAWATCERAYSGGWATREAIFAVRSAYDLESETYRISLLAHEGQHFSDYARFPKLEQPELEYRAKLTEIALADASTRELLKVFTEASGASRESPHAWANGKVIADLQRELGTQDLAAADLPALHAAARKLLAASTAALSRAG